MLSAVAVDFFVSFYSITFNFYPIVHHNPMNLITRRRNNVYGNEVKMQKYKKYKSSNHFRRKTGRGKRDNFSL